MPRGQLAQSQIGSDFKIDTSSANKSDPRSESDMLSGGLGTLPAQSHAFLPNALTNLHQDQLRPHLTSFVGGNVF